MQQIICKNGCLPTRLVVAVMLFTACFIAYMLRVNMSINILAMVEPMKADDKKASNVGECIRKDNVTFNESDQHTIAPDYGVRYQWDSQAQGLILGSYFWGYILTSIPGALVAERFGPTLTITTVGVLSAVLTVLTPLAASWHYTAVIVLRFVLGFCGGVLYPAIHCLIAKWAPPVEKGKFTSTMMGGTLGTMMTWPVLGAVIEHWSWQWAFYAPGLLTIVWCVAWYFLVSDSPETHPRISEEEKMHIVKSLGGSVNKKKSLPPYLQMFTSIPFWALSALHFGNLWGLYLLLTAGPKYMSEVLGFNLGHSGALAALPYLARMLSGFVFGYLGDVIRQHQWLSVTTTRKAFVAFSHFLPGLLLFSMTLTGCDAILSVAMVTMSLGFNGASTLTNLQNNQDLAPNFAGTIYGIINCFGGTTGFIIPAITGLVTFENNGLHEWNIIFSIGASVYIASGIVFVAFGSGDQQPWNKVEETEQNGVENPAFEGENKESHTSEGENKENHTFEGENKEDTKEAEQTGRTEENTKI